jgi:hypothetical protein
MWHLELQNRSLGLLGGGRRKLGKGKGRELCKQRLFCYVGKASEVIKVAWSPLPVTGTSLIISFIDAHFFPNRTTSQNNQLRLY